MKGRDDYKIFGIGLGKTGTTSLAHAMAMLGYKSKHGCKNEQQVIEHDFLCDIPVAWQYPLFDYIYQNAKFILTIRDIDDWIKSSTDHVKPGKTRHGGEKGSLNRLSHRFWCYGICHFDEEIFRVAYRRHVEKAIEHFRGREDKLLILDLCGGEGWEKLCPFLGKDIPNKPFPYKNKTRGT